MAAEHESEGAWSSASSVRKRGIASELDDVVSFGRSRQASSKDSPPAPIRNAPIVARSDCAESSVDFTQSCSAAFDGPEAIDDGGIDKPRDDSSNSSTSSKLALSTKVFLGIGESVQGIYVVISGYYLNSFLLETACIDPMYVGLIQAIQGAFDAVNDPLIGALSDRTRTRWGRRRPWLLMAAPFLAVSYFALWNALPQEVQQFWKFIYALVVHMCVSVGISSIQVQIGALVPELTDDYDERTSVSAFRLFIGNLVGFLCAIAHNQIISFGGKVQIDASSRYRISGALFALILWVSAWTTFAGVRERFQSRCESRKSMSIKTEVRTILRNRAFLCVVGAYLCGPTAICLIQSNIFMFCKYVLKDASIIKLIIPCVQGTALITMPIWVLLSRQFGKKWIYFVGVTVLSIAVLCIYFITDIYGGLTIAVVIGICGPLVYLVPYSMLPDVIEEDELRTGKRREGIFVGFFTITLKISVTTALTITNFALKAAGYQAPVTSCGATEEMNVEVGEQPEVVVLFFRVLCGPLPVAFFVLAMVFVWGFPITRSKQKELAKIAAQARLDRQIANCDTSSCGSTHSPRDVKALADFINDIADQKNDGTKVMEAMSSQLCELKFQEYQLAGPRTVRVSFHEEETRGPSDTLPPRKRQSGASDSDRASAQSYGVTASTESGDLTNSQSQPTKSSLTVSSKSGSMTRSAEDEPYESTVAAI